MSNLNRSSMFVLLLSVLWLMACQISYLIPQTGPTATSTRAATRTATALAKQPVTPGATVASVVPVAPIAPTAVPVPVTAVATEDVRVRSTPSTSGAIVDRLNKGDRVNVLARTAASDWLQVALPQKPGTTGWVSSQYLKASMPVDSIPLAESSGGPVAPVQPPVVPGQPPLIPGQPPVGPTSPIQSPLAPPSTQPYP